MRLPSNAQRASLEARIQAAEANLAGAGMGYLISRGITTETARRFRLGCDPQTGRLTIPYLSPAGPWHVKYRCIAHDNCKQVHADKYSYDPGSGQHLYNASTLLDAERVVVVEGELDAVTAEQAGVPAVAFPGAQTWQRNTHWRWCFDSCIEITVVADGDEPGRKAAGVVAESLRRAVQADVDVAVLPDGEDTNSLIGSRGVGAWLGEIGWL